MYNPTESLTVSELNNYIRDVLNSGFPQPVWICGEIQGYERGKDKKHVFFELCEKDCDSHEIKARIGLVIFANRRATIDALLQRAENAFILKDDIEVRFLCKVDFYPGHGQIRLIVESIDPTYTLGKIAQDRQRLIALLKQKGLLDRNKQLELPRLPLSIGLITSYDSAAYHDFIDELKKSGYTFTVWMVNSLMQGKNAETSVVRSIKLLNQLEEIDVIVITRGGGSIAELSCFDSQAIAEAIAFSTLPVLSGIGHEINTTVTDLAAHTYAKTPTAIAHFLIGRIEEFLGHLKEKQEFLFQTVEQKLQTYRLNLRNQVLNLQRLPSSLLKQARQQRGQHVNDLKKTIYLRLQTSRTKIKMYEQLIDVADPRNTLKRGFSITRNLKGRVIRSVTDVKKPLSIKTQFADGTIVSDITEVSKDGYNVSSSQIPQGRRTPG